MTVEATPRITKIVAVLFSVLLIIVMTILWCALDARIRQQFTWPQVLTLLLFMIVGICFMLGMGFSKVAASPHGLYIRNGLARHQLDWSQIAGIRFKQADPWAYVILKPGHPSGKDRYPLLGIQQTDGSRAVALAQAVADCQPTKPTH